MNEIKYESKSSNIPMMPEPDFRKDFGRGMGYANGKNDWFYELLAEMRF